MNWQALFDGLLATVAFWMVLKPARQLPAMRLGCLLLGSAAVLGTLRFSGVLPLPPLHQFVSMLGAGVGLPLLAIAIVAPHSAVATERRFTWIFAVVAAVVCLVLMLLVQFKLWSSACALVSAVAIVGTAGLRKRWLVLLAGLSILLALLAFAAQLRAGELLPGEFLHIGLALGLWLLGRSVLTVHDQPERLAGA